MVNPYEDTDWSDSSNRAYKDRSDYEYRWSEPQPYYSYQYHVNVPKYDEFIQKTNDNNIPPNPQKTDKPKLSKVDSIYLLRPELRESYYKLPHRPTAPKLEDMK